jgi:alkylation response protein AidB-like acyl-CoA dehydrogenase
MSVELTELQDSARRVLDGAGLAAAEEAIWSQIIELGWLLVAVPEALGGLEAGVLGATTMHAELGRRLSTAPYLPAMLAVDAICQSDLVERESWLERLVGCELITASLAECGIRANGNRLDGTATGVQSADSASHILVWTACNDVVALVALDQSGVEIVARPTWDQTRRLFDVRLASVDLADQTILAEGADAGVLIQRLLAQRDFALAADAIGGASALLDLTVEHLQTRVQFKRPLAMFQALKHRCADMKASIAAAEAMLSDGLRRVGDGLDSADARHKSMGAKMLATSMCARVAEDCLQLHGGIGMADEHPCHLFLKRSLLSEQLSGSANAYAAELALGLLANTK